MLIFELCGYKVFSTSENIHVPYFFLEKLMHFSEHVCKILLMNYRVYIFLQYKNLYTSRIWYPEVNIFVV